MASRRSAIQEAAKTQKAVPNKKLTRRPAAPEPKEREKKPAPSSRSAGTQTMRVMLTIVGFVVAILLGMIVGYALLGHKSIADILYPETWAHIFQLVFAP